MPIDEPADKKKTVNQAKSKFTPKKDESGKKTERILFGNSTPEVYQKVTNHDGIHKNSKEYVIKAYYNPKVLNTEASAQKEFLSYRILAELGVTVPKTYIVEDKEELEGKTIYKLASRKIPGYQDMADVLGFSKNTNPSKEEKSEQQKKVAEMANTRTINGKEVKGFWEHAAIFAFCGDPDFVGERYRNIGFINRGKYYEAVKIDANISSSVDGLLPTMNNLVGMKAYLDQTHMDHRGYFGSNQAELFKETKEDEMWDGLKRIAKLTPDKLHAIIYDPEIPEDIEEKSINNFAKFTKATRDELYTTLINKRSIMLKNYSQAPGCPPIIRLAHLNNELESKLQSLQRLDTGEAATNAIIQQLNTVCQSNNKLLMASNIEPSVIEQAVQDNNSLLSIASELESNQRNKVFDNSQPAGKLATLNIQLKNIIEQLKDANIKLIGTPPPKDDSIEKTVKKLEDLYQKNKTLLEEKPLEIDNKKFKNDVNTISTELNDAAKKTRFPLINQLINKIIDALQTIATKIDPTIKLKRITEPEIVQIKNNFKPSRLN